MLIGSRPVDDQQPEKGMLASIFSSGSFSAHPSFPWLLWFGLSRRGQSGKWIGSVTFLGGLLLLTNLAGFSRAMVALLDTLNLRLEVLHGRRRQLEKEGGCVRSVLEEIYVADCLLATVRHVICFDLPPYPPIFPPSLGDGCPGCPRSSCPQQQPARSTKRSFSNDSTLPLAA